ncbi:MAG: pyrroloquinoline quinone biosynthesis protein [Micromonosporaceae bacterium]|jgi:pyrroloquinoline quinone biosynthesis protein D
MAPTPTLDPAAVAERRRETRVRKYRGILFVANGVDAFELNDVAEFIFRQVDGRQTVQQIAEHVASAYDIPLYRALVDTGEAVAQLAAQAMLTLDR